MHLISIIQSIPTLSEMELYYDVLFNNTDTDCSMHITNDSYYQSDSHWLNSIFNSFKRWWSDSFTLFLCFSSFFSWSVRSSFRFAGSHLLNTLHTLSTISYPLLIMLWYITWSVSVTVLFGNSRRVKKSRERWHEKERKNGRK